MQHTDPDPARGSNEMLSGASLGVPMTTPYGGSPNTEKKPEKRKYKTKAKIAAAAAAATAAGTPITPGTTGEHGTSSGAVPFETADWFTNTAHQVNEKGVPIDMAAAMKYIEEPLEEYKQVDLSQRLLQRKQEEDEGVQADSDYDGEDFEDLLELFDIDPEETPLDMDLNQRQQMLLESMDENQLSRYEFFRRTNLNTNGIKKLVSNAVGQTISNDFAKIIAGAGKVFVGELVEKAKEVQRKQNQAKVLEQLSYKRKLKEYEEEVEALEGETKRRRLAGEDVTDLPRLEEVEKPLPPTFVGGKDAAGVAAKSRAASYSSFKVKIPEDSTQLTPDHLREAWRLYQEENGVVEGRWRKQGGGDGWMFR